MKVSLLSAALILIAASFFGWQGHARLVDAREDHGRLVAEAEAMGLDASGTANGADGKAAQTKTRRDDPGDKAAVVKAFSAKLVAFAKEMEAMQKEGKQPDEDMQKRMFEVLEVMLSLDAAQLKLLVAEIRGTTDLSDEMRTGILGFAVMMLANDHPAAALAIFTESGDLMKETGSSQHVISSAVARLAQEDPMAALDWIRKNSKEHPEMVTDQTKRGVLAGAARQDPKLAFSLIAELGFEDGSRAVGSIVETATTTEQRKAVLAAMRDHAKTLGPEAAAAITKETLKELGQGLSRQGHDGTVAWLKESGLSPEETADFAEGVQPWQTKSETGKWIGWLAENVPGDKMEIRVTLFMNQWARDDYKAAGLWLNDFKDGPAKDAAVKSYADSVAPYEPASAAEWALTLPEGEERKKLLISIHDQWKSKDAEAAAEFARENGIGE
jgi:hypothetical protein